MEDITIFREQIKLIVKELFDNGNRGLICFKDDILIDVYLNLDATRGFQIVECIYDLKKLKKKAVDLEYSVIKYKDISDFEWLCDQYLYDDFDEEPYCENYLEEAINRIYYYLYYEHYFKRNDDIILDLAE